MVEADISLFEVAAKVVSDFGTSGQKMSNDQALELYGLFKQGNVGDVNTGRPGILDQKGRVKWDARNALKGISNNAAKARYVSSARAALPAEWAARIA